MIYKSQELAVQKGRAVSVLSCPDYAGELRAVASHLKDTRAVVLSVKAEYANLLRSDYFTSLLLVAIVSLQVFSLVYKRSRSD